MSRQAWVGNPAPRLAAGAAGAAGRTAGARAAAARPSRGAAGAARSEVRRAPMKTRGDRAKERQAHAARIGQFAQDQRRGIQRGLRINESIARHVKCWPEEADAGRLCASLLLVSRAGASAARRLLQRSRRAAARQLQQRPAAAADHHHVLPGRSSLLPVQVRRRLSGRASSPSRRTATSSSPPAGQVSVCSTPTATTLGRERATDVRERCRAEPRPRHHRDARLRVVGHDGLPLAVRDRRPRRDRPDGDRSSRGIPNGGHSTRTLVVDAQNRLYVSIGSASNVDAPAGPTRRPRRAR